MATPTIHRSVQSSHRWGGLPRSRTVAYYHRRLAEIVRQRLASSGKRWEDAVWDPSLELARADFQALEDELLATGLRFQMSAGISVAEAPHKYEAPVAEELAKDTARDAEGRIVVGGGDNVFQTPSDVIGIARFIGKVETVLDMLQNGVPPETVAIIDDSGGTLTAPILEGFKAVVCKGGSVRSHLGILTREYRIPCLMASEVRGLKDGDRVQVEYSVPAKMPYERDAARGRARVWLLP